MTRLLILGGTTEAAALARQLAGRAGLEVVTSLAGRTKAPAGLPGLVRVGGFGGAEGLEAWLRAEGIALVVDATHPFAARISAHAEAACAAAEIPRLVLGRPDWQQHPDDRWIWAEDMAAAARMVPGLGRRVFLTVGSGELCAFSQVQDAWFLVRLLAPMSVPLINCSITVGRGPFDLRDELRLLAEYGIDLMVAKAAGGEATHAKIQAARLANLPVLMVRRPPPPNGQIVRTVAEAVEWVLSNIR